VAVFWQVRTMRTLTHLVRPAAAQVVARSMGSPIMHMFYRVLSRGGEGGREGGTGGGMVVLPPGGGGVGVGGGGERVGAGGEESRLRPQRARASRHALSALPLTRARVPAPRCTNTSPT
jgi:hypothetical protein